MRHLRGSERRLQKRQALAEARLDALERTRRLNRELAERELEAKTRIKWEYDLLSEDRREAIKIYSTAAWIGTAIIGLGFLRLADAKTKVELVVLFLLGIVLMCLFYPTVKQCREHGLAIHTRLDELGRASGLNPLIPTDYIFKAVFSLGVFFFFTWCVVFVHRLVSLL